MKAPRLARLAELTRGAALVGLGAGVACATSQSSNVVTAPILEGDAGGIALVGEASAPSALPSASTPPPLPTSEAAEGTRIGDGGPRRRGPILNAPPRLP